MIDWENINYSKIKAERKFKEYEERGPEGLRKIEVKKDYKQLRQDLISKRDIVFDRYDLDSVEKQGYLLDVSFGIEVYELLINDYNFTFRDFSNDDIWRFLQLEIVPDIVFSRWDFKASRFYMDSRRLWMKTVFWYVHLSWQGDKNSTIAILKDNSTDTIMQLVERPGIGYNIGLYREIMKHYSEWCKKDDVGDTRKLFRKILILNNARVSSIIPGFTEDYLPGYVEKLYKDV